MRIRPSLSHVDAYPGPTFSRKGFLRLDMNENSFGCAPQVLRALRHISADELNMYPEYGPFKRRLAATHRLAPENVCITAGGDEAIRVIMEAFVEAGDEVLIPRPTFAIYPLAASLQRAKIVDVPYGMDFAFPLEALIGRIGKKTRAVVVVSPNNPTGTAVGRLELERILQKIPAGILILDQTYHLFGGGHFSGLLRRHRNLLVLHSFSKSHGLAGLRLGYALADAETISGMEKIRPPYSVNSLALVAAGLALENMRAALDIARRIRRERVWLEKKLTALGLRVWPSQANFLLVDLGGDCEQILARLRAENILLKGFPGEPRLAGLTRITVGRPGQNRFMLRKLAAVLAEMKKQKERGNETIVIP